MFKLNREGHPGEGHDVVAVKCEGETEEDVAESSTQSQIEVKTEPAVDIDHIKEEEASDTDAVEFKLEEIDGFCRVGDRCEVRGSGVGCAPHGGICTWLRCVASDSIGDKRGISKENVGGVDAGGFALGNRLQLKSEEIDLGCDSFVADPIACGQPHLKSEEIDAVEEAPSEGKRHTREKPHMCKICDRKFQYRSQLDFHMLMHSGVKPHVCKMCGNKFNHKGNLNKHMLTHTGEKPHTCEVCERKFPLKCNLNRHMMTHTGEKPYTCTICDHDKRFAEKNGLKKHMLIHTGEKPYACTVCGKKVAQKSHLIAHMLMHTGEKSHACTLCDRKFVMKRSLVRHMATHGERKPLTCTVCERVFARKVNLRQHMSTHINDKPATDAT